MQQHLLFLNQKLAKTKETMVYRALKILGGKVDFCSNDYLGFAKNPTIHSHKTTTTKTPTNYGSTGSRLISGNSEAVENLEAQLQIFYHSAAALIFNSGYNANVGFFQCIPQRADTILYDEYIHASVRDGIKLSNANHFSFKHNSLADLKNKLQRTKGLVYVVVESVYSMDGDQASLKEIAALCRQNNAALIVDEAHAVGVIGKGKGCVMEEQLENDVFARIVTFGKALGTHGAVVLCSPTVKEYLINFSRAFIYTTALPLSAINTIANAHIELEKITNRKHLQELISYFNEKTLKTSYHFLESTSAIQSLIIPGNEAAKKLANYFQQNGFDIKAILHPTVPKGMERLRICLHSYNTTAEINQFFELLENFKPS